MAFNFYNYIRINGILLFDSKEQKDKPNIQCDLSNIRINLYRVIKRNLRITKDDNINIATSSEKLVATTRTSKNGSFVFVVPRGRYIVAVDENTVPEGFGVLKKRLALDGLYNYKCIFKLREIHSIENTYNTKCTLSDDFVFYPCNTLKDIEGNVIHGHVNYDFDKNLVGLDNTRFYLKKGLSDVNKAAYKVFSGNISREVEIKFKPKNDDDLDRVRFDYDHGLIDNHTKIKRYIELLFDRRNLYSRGYIPMPPLKSGTTAVKEILDYISSEDADADIAAQAKKYIDTAVPKLDKVYVSPSKFFRIHYTMTGSNAVSAIDLNRNGIPDYIEEIGNAFDNSRKITCLERGFREPVLESNDKNYDVYVYNLKGVYGITFAKRIKKNIKSGSRIASSYICIDNNYSKDKGFKKSKLDCMRVTAAHEFFHAVQNAYNLDADSWWKEASATWNEDEVYHGINDYIQYVGKVFSAPGKPLEKNSYSGVVFAKYLSENHGGYDIIKSIWETHAKGVNNSLNAIDIALTENSKGYYDIGRAFNQYTAYNYNPSQYYKEGKLWEVDLYIKSTYTTYPVAEQKTYLDHMAADYILFKAEDNRAGTLQITLRTEANEKMGFKIQKRLKQSGLCEISEIISEGTANRADISCFGFGDIYSEICLIPANLDKSRDNVQYEYSTEML